MLRVAVHYVAWMLLVSPSSAGAGSAAAALPYAGFCYTASAPLSSASSDASLKAIRDQTGATHIEVVVERYQTYLNSTVIAPPDVPVSNTTQLLHAIATINSLGMQAVLKPHVECKCGVWRANIKMESAADWTTWFTGSYTPYIVEMAKLSQQQNLPALNIGTELGHMHETFSAIFNGRNIGDLPLADAISIEIFRQQFGNKQVGRQAKRRTGGT